MSDTSTLISKNGKITRAELKELPTPPATATHVSDPTCSGRRVFVQTLSHRHIDIVGKEFAVSSDKFGVNRDSWYQFR